MKKTLGFAALFAGAIVFARRFAAAERDVDWEERLERMPDSSPRKWMLSNIAAIRTDTERIREILEQDVPE